MIVLFFGFQSLSFEDAIYQSFKELLKFARDDNQIHKCKLIRFNGQIERLVNEFRDNKEVQKYVKYVKYEGYILPDDYKL